MLVRRSAVEIPHLVAVVDSQRARDGRTRGVKGHVEPAVLAEVIEHGRKILGLSRDEAVAHAGGEHQLGKRGHHFLAADSDRHAFALGKADIVAPLLVKTSQQLFFCFSFDIQAEDIARLDGLKVLTAFLAAETQLVEQACKLRIGRRYVGVDFDDVGAVLLRQRLCALDELGGSRT